MKVPVGVVVSGSGSNLQALIDACVDPAYPARIAVVVSDRAAAFGLERARNAGIPAVHLGARSFAGDRDAYDAALAAVLADHGAEWVCLAGFMRIVGPGLLARYPWRVLNIHPSLLPAFPGLHAQRQALDHGVRIAGATVHLVDGGMDTGPIVVQAVVPVHEDDDEGALSKRILAEEHRIYPEALRLAAEGRLVVDGRRVRTDGTLGGASRPEVVGRRSARP